MFLIVDGTVSSSMAMFRRIKCINCWYDIVHYLRVARDSHIHFMKNNINYNSVLYFITPQGEMQNIWERNILTLVTYINKKLNDSKLK